MDENNVVTATMVAADMKDGVTTVEAPGAETVKTEPAKTENPDNAEVQKLKDALSRANGEAAEYKRQAASYKEQLRAKQTEAERAEADRAEQDKAMREELATLRRDKSISEYTAKCVTLNMDAELAAKTANAMADGDMNAMFDCLKAFVEATTTRLNNEALNRQPALSTGTPPSTNTIKDDETDMLRRYAGLPPRR